MQRVLRSAIATTDFPAHRLAKMRCSCCLEIMSSAQLLIFGILTATVGMFLWGRWRHDMVAAGALLACVITGLIPAAHAFSGFGHPAVITVACVLILSRGLQTSGAVDVLTRRLLPTDAGPTLTIITLTSLGALLSGFMNNVGALALLMPVAIQMARRLDMPPGRVLMPLSFGSILGGMTTLIGTPPNLIVSGFRTEVGSSGFGMFDFTPVGVVVAVAGVLFITLIGYRLVPNRRAAGEESFDTAAYLTEARVQEGSKSAGKSLHELESQLESAGAQIVGLVRNEVRLYAPGAGRIIQPNDILIIEADAENLATLLSDLGLVLEAAKDAGEESAAAAEDPRTGSTIRADKETKTATNEVVLTELAVLPGSNLVGRSAHNLLLRTRYGVNLLAVSRQGQRVTTRLRALPLRAGDLLMLQGPSEVIAEFASVAACVPLAPRALRIPAPRQAVLAATIMGASVGIAAIGLLPAAIAFAIGVLVSMAFRTIPPRAAYDAVDWPIIVLLACLIPVAGAMETTGAANLVARGILDTVAQGNAIIALAVIMIVTLTLSDVMNNAATAAVMCPIALGTAAQLGVNPDSYLMAVAIGASCAFLTPIAHQNNTLILGPGGFRFGDYWRLGLPLEVIVVAVSLPLVLVVWPL